MNKSITYTGANPHLLPDIKSFLRVFHSSEDDLIQSIYDAALARIESRTRRFLRAVTIDYKYNDWINDFRVGYGVDISSAGITYKDGAGDTQTYTGDIAIKGQCIVIGEKPDDYPDNGLITLSIEAVKYERLDLDNMVLMLTAQWYENRGDQNIKGGPEWIERVCFNHAWQSF